MRIELAPGVVVDSANVAPAILALYLNPGPRGCYCRLDGFFGGWHLPGAAGCVDEPVQLTFF